MDKRDLAPSSLSGPLAGPDPAADVCEWPYEPQQRVIALCVETSIEHGAAETAKELR